MKLNNTDKPTKFYQLLAKIRSSSHNRHRWRYLLLILLLVILPFLTGILPTVSFIQEQIDIEVYPDHVQMTGYYNYRNSLPFPVVQGMSIPLPIDSTHSTPVEIEVEELSPIKQQIPFRYLFDRHRFNLAFSAGEEIQLRVRYYQYTPDKNARYILTTTQPWRHSLKNGLYRLFPKGVKITSSNYPLNSVDTDILTFQRTDFMPTEDWQFAWESQ